MEAVIFCGIQATGKSTFFKERFVDTHMRLNLDMLKTRHRESVLFRACLEAKQPFVIDNTNPKQDDRRRYIADAKTSHFRVVGYYFESKIGDALDRNARREGKARIHDGGIKSTHASLELPKFSEGFDELYYVRMKAGGGFEVKEWSNEV